MQPWAIIGTFVGIMAFLFVVFIELNSSFEKKIVTKLKDPIFLRKMANEVRLPFVIFDEDNSVIVDTGAMAIIDKIALLKEDGKNLSEIVITPKKFLAVPPILESFDPKIEFQDPIRGNQLDLIYNKVKMASVFQNTYATKPPKSKFRLQIILLPE